MLTSRAGHADLTVPAHRIPDLLGARRLLGPEPDVPAPPALRAETAARSEPDTVCQHVLHGMGRHLDTLLRELREAGADRVADAAVLPVQEHA